ncbi:TBC1 domain family member 15 like [Actinidia chinensis var. chinensis]|uniref:TBC1 domain family member 15 like n=1 Tax=Actinidia chinensis var. chinensis TaxID=1590841 RepID=A0A2R6R935_ACTCC|nr:TBC1 domain family member 15 like [Actinidia chinensis var. chinensis]
MGVTVNLHRVSSIVRNFGEPCLHQLHIKVIIAISKMLKPDKWQANFDRDGKVFGFQKALKLISLGGMDPSLRPEVWEFLLGSYALSSTAQSRRERYRELVKQCQLMHSSIGTGSLAYVVGSKVMDMRTMSKDDRREAEVKNLFEKSGKDRRGHVLQDSRLSRQHKNRFKDEHMHSFQINNNADLVMESNGSPSNNVSHPTNHEIEMVHPHVHEPVSRPNNPEYKADKVNRLRISDAPEIPMVNATTPEGAAVSEDRISEWLWTLHQIVVDVVRTDCHLEFYEDTKNLARMADILAVYAWVDPGTGYCQGMSDLLSPFVLLFEDDADAFWCFEMLLRRTRENFQMEGPTGVMKQLQALWHILELTDKKRFTHLSHTGAESLHFAFRMLLVLFRREVSLNEALCMWEMMWAADFDESMAFNLEEYCLEPLVIQIPRKSGAETEREGIGNDNASIKGGLQSNHERAERSIFYNRGNRTASTHTFCGLTTNFWSKNDHLCTCSVFSSSRNGDDELPIFCVAAILIMNCQRIIKETHSIDDLIKIFNDRVLKFRVKRCVRRATKLRKKYCKLMKSRSPSS